MMEVVEIFSILLSVDQGWLQLIKNSFEQVLIMDQFCCITRNSQTRGILYAICVQLTEFSVFYSRFKIYRTHDTMISRVTKGKRNVGYQCKDDRMYDDEAQ